MTYKEQLDATSEADLSFAAQKPPEAVAGVVKAAPWST